MRIRRISPCPPSWNILIQWGLKHEFLSTILQYLIRVLESVDQYLNIILWSLCSLRNYLISRKFNLLFYFYWLFVNRQNVCWSMSRHSDTPYRRFAAFRHIKRYWLLSCTFPILNPLLSKICVWVLIFNVLFTL